MIPLQTIVTAARPYAIAGAQSAAIGFCTWSGYALGVFTLYGVVKGVEQVIDTAKEATHLDTYLPAFLSAKKRRFKAHVAEQLERERLRAVITSIFAERDQAAGKPSSWQDLPAGGRTRPDGQGAPASA